MIYNIKPVIKINKYLAPNQLKSLFVCQSVMTWIRKKTPISNFLHMKSEYMVNQSLKFEFKSNH